MSNWNKGLIINYTIIISSPKIRIMPTFAQIGIKNKPILRAANAFTIDGPIFCSTICSTHEIRFF